MTFWELPGTVRYVEEIAQMLRTGSNIVVRFPINIPKSFRDRVFSALRGDGLRPTLLPGGSRPMETLCERFLHGESSNLDSLPHLCDSDEFTERLIWLEDISPMYWKSWSEFLISYADASRSIAVHRRTLFVVPLICSSSDAVPSIDVIRVFDWDNVIDEMDILCYASDRLRRRQMEQSLVYLLAMTIARLAVWDFDTAERLVDQSPETILEPGPCLRRLAKQRGWSKDTAICWSLGTASQSGIAHPARLALEESSREIERRIWSAQASVLLPRIDIQRVEIIRNNLFEVRKWLRHRNRDDDPFDLEIGDLFSVFQGTRADPKVRTRVWQLRSARNKLAHIESLSPHSAFQIAGICDV